MYGIIRPAIVRLGGAGVNEGLARFPPPQLVQPDRVFEATQLGLAQVTEHELLPCRQLPNDDGGENLACLRSPMRSAIRSG